MAFLKHSRTCGKEVTQPDEKFFHGLTEKLRLFKHEMKPKFKKLFDEKFTHSFPQQVEEYDDCHKFKTWWEEDRTWWQGEVNTIGQKNGRLVKIDMQGMTLAYYYEDMLHGRSDKFDAFGTYEQ